jgi:hypothetical protein
MKTAKYMVTKNTGKTLKPFINTKLYGFKYFTHEK